MQAADLTAPVKSISWVALILPIKISIDGWKEDQTKDFGKPFPFEKRTSIRPAISGRIRIMYPDRKYKTYEEIYQGSDPRYKEFKGKLSLVVRRLK